MVNILSIGKIQLALFYLHQPKSLLRPSSIHFFRFWKKTVEVLQINFRFFCTDSFKASMRCFLYTHLHFENFEIIFEYLNLLDTNLLYLIRFCKALRLYLKICPKMANLQKSKYLLRNLVIKQNGAKK